MAPTTSGTQTFNMAVDEIINEAYDKIGGQPVGGVDAKKGRTALNLLLLDLSSRGIPLSAVDYISTSLTSAQASITLPSYVVDIIDITLLRATTEYPLNRYSLSEFLRIPNKTTTAMPTTYTINRGLGSTTLKLWPTPDRSSDVINYYANTKIEDVTASYQYLDLPSRYLPAMIFGTAHLLSFNRVDISKEKRDELKMMFEEFLKNARDEDAEHVSNQITPYPYTR